MKKYPKNHFGYSQLVECLNDDSLYNLNLSIEKIIKTDPRLNHIKLVSFYLENPNEESNGNNNTNLMVNIHLKSGLKVTKLYSSHVDEGAIELSRGMAQAYFGNEKYQEVRKFFENGSLEWDFLRKFEPDLLEQLKIQHLLICTPNTKEGAEFTDEDYGFFLELNEAS